MGTALVIACWVAGVRVESSAATLSEPSTMYWRSDPILGQLGCARVELCFFTNGRYRITFRSQAVAIPETGTYSWKDGAYLLVPDDSDRTITFVYRNEGLVLLDAKEEPPLRPMESSCPSSDDLLSPTPEEEKACFGD
jgi:hypothetical protein